MKFFYWIAEGKGKNEKVVNKKKESKWQIMNDLF